MVDVKEILKKRFQSITIPEWGGITLYYRPLTLEEQAKYFEITSGETEIERGKSAADHLPEISKIICGCLSHGGDGGGVLDEEDGRQLFNAFPAVFARVNRLVFGREDDDNRPLAQK